MVQMGCLIFKMILTQIFVFNDFKDYFNGAHFLFDDNSYDYTSDMTMMMMLIILTTHVDKTVVRLSLEHKVQY